MCLNSEVTVRSEHFKLVKNCMKGKLLQISICAKVSKRNRARIYQHQWHGNGSVSRLWSNCLFSTPTSHTPNTKQFESLKIHHQLVNDWTEFRKSLDQEFRRIPWSMWAVSNKSGDRRLQFCESRKKKLERELANNALLLQGSPKSRPLDSGDDKWSVLCLLFHPTLHFFRKNLSLLPFFCKKIFFLF